MTRIITACTSPADYGFARALIGEYLESLGVDLSLQLKAVDSDFDHLDEVYGPPQGCLLLALLGDDFVGCVGVRRVDDDACEMKRLYVQPRARGQGIGHMLALAAIDAARRTGYRRMVLDTLNSMAAARSLYSSLGFRERGPYYANPPQNIAFMELLLNSE